MAVSTCGLLLFLDVHDRGLGRQEQRGDACGVLEGDAFDLGGDDDAHLDHVAELVGEGVVAEVGLVALFDFAGDD